MKVSFWTKFGIGVKSYLDAFKFVFNNGLWVYFFYPIIIAILMFIGGYALIDVLAEKIETMVMGYFEADATGWTAILTGFLSFFIRIAFKIFFFFIYSTFSKYILLIVMSPIMALLSERTDEIITGKKYPFKMDQFVRDIFRGIAIALRNMFIEFGIIIASFFVMWIPVIGWLMPIVLLLISYYYYGFSMIDYTSERRKLKIKESIRYIRDNKGLAMGNGFIFSLLFSIPLLGGMLASVVAPVAATIAVFELERKKVINRFMEKIKVSVVSYLNSKPFIYGLQQSNILNAIDLSLDIPAVCAQKLLDDKVDIGLIPVAVIPLLKEKYILSDYCIGAVGKVASVLLYSKVPLEKIEKIILDYQSRTSVQLVQILAKHFWKINPDFEAGNVDYENKISGTTAVVVIGDRTFDLSGKYKYEYDLAEEWNKFTGLPFVFACWVSNKKLGNEFLEQFNAALRFGIENKNELIHQLKNSAEYAFDIETYLSKNIHFEFDSAKKQGLELFLSYLPK